MLSAQTIGNEPSVSVHGDRGVYLTGGLSTGAAGEQLPTGETLFSASTFRVDILLSKLEAGKPNIRSLGVSAESIVEGGAVTLSAHGVLDIGGRVGRVDFYRDVNGDGLLDAGDVLLGTDSDVSDAWTFAATGLAFGTQKFLAVATDDDAVPLASDAASATVEVTAAPSGNTFTSTDTPLSIADPHRKKGPRTTTSDIDISSSDTIAALTVDVDITHAAEGDLMLPSSRRASGRNRSPTTPWAAPGV